MSEELSHVIYNSFKLPSYASDEYIDSFASRLLNFDILKVSEKQNIDRITVLFWCF